MEVETLEQAIEAAEANADIIMLDNMPPDEIKNVIGILKDRGLEGAMFEASGNITPENLRDYAESGVDIISMGWLTHSVMASDISLDIDGD